MTEGVVWEEIYRRQGAAGQTAEEEGRGAKGEGRDHFSPKSTSETGKVGRREIARKLADPVSYYPYCNIWKTWENISLGRSISNKFLGSLSLR